MNVVWDPKIRKNVSEQFGKIQKSSDIQLIIYYGKCACFDHCTMVIKSLYQGEMGEMYLGTQQQCFNFSLSPGIQGSSVWLQPSLGPETHFLFSSNRAFSSAFRRKAVLVKVRPRAAPCLLDPSHPPSSEACPQGHPPAPTTHTLDKTPCCLSPGAPWWMPNSSDYLLTVLCAHISSREAGRWSAQGLCVLGQDTYPL